MDSPKRISPSVDARWRASGRTRPTARTGLLSRNISDLAAFEVRAMEPVLEFESVVKALRRRGKL